MGFWRGKMSDNTAYDKLISTLESQIVDLKKEKSELVGLVKDCFKALAAKESPMYYNDARDAGLTKTKTQVEQEDRQQLESKLYNEYINGIEQRDFFASPEDMKKYLEELDADDIISKVMPHTIDTPGSVHGNEES